MPRMENSGGDSLARGASRYTFRPAGEKLTQEKWDDIFGDFDPEAFKNSGKPTDPNAVKANSTGGYAENSSDSDSTQTGTTGTDAGEVSGE